MSSSDTSSRGPGRPALRQTPHVHTFAVGQEVWVLVKEKPLRGFEARVVEHLPPRLKSSSVVRYRLSTGKDKELVRSSDNVFGSRRSAYRSIRDRREF